MSLIVNLGEMSLSCISQIPHSVGKQIYLLVGYFAAAMLSSDLVMEVQAAHFHSSPTHTGLLHLKKRVF